MASVHAISKGWLRMQLSEVAGHAVAVYPAFRKVLGLNAAASQMLSQAVYWTEKAKDGWFYKTNDQWNDELGLTVEEVKGARKKLKALGVLEEKRRGVPAKMHYCVNQSTLLSLLSGENPLSSSGETPHLELVKPANCSAGNPPTITKTTQKTTTESIYHTPLIFLRKIAPPVSIRPIVDCDWKPSAVAFKGGTFTVQPGVIDRWAKAFPGLDIDGEIQNAATWAADNPKKAKKDWQRFLSGWMRRAHKNLKRIDEGSVPVDRIIDLYHRACPNLAPVSVASDATLRSMIVERWNESPAHQSGQDFWVPFFLKANNRNQVYYRGQNIAPRLEALVSRAVFREIAEAQQ